MVRPCKIFYYLFIVLIALAQFIECFASSPWTPEEGENSLSFFYAFETFDEFYRGVDKTDLPFGHSDQHSVNFIYEYGLTDDLVVDASLGYVYIQGGGGLGSEEGLNDSQINFKYRLLNEWESENSLLPSIALGLNATIAGSYDDNVFPISPGDGFHGIKPYLSVGKFLDLWSLGLVGNLGYRVREGEVPDELEFDFAVLKSIAEVWDFSAKYIHVASQTGLDIGGAEFSPEKSRLLKELVESIEFSVGYAISPDYFLAVVYNRTIDGRNTGAKDIFGLFASFSF